MNGNNNNNNDNNNNDNSNNNNCKKCNITLIYIELIKKNLQHFSRSSLRWNMINYRLITDITIRETFFNSDDCQVKKYFALLKWLIKFEPSYFI